MLVCKGCKCVVMMTCPYFPLTSLAEDVILLGPLGDRPQKSYGRLGDGRLRASSATDVD